MNKVPIILAGGSGSRLWPYSRQNYPKQILNLLGTKSLIQDTALRFNNTIDKENFRIVTNSNQKHLIEKDFSDIDLIHNNLIIEEPSAKNTAAAILLSAMLLDDDDIMIVLPSDHVIKDTKNFQYLIEKACKLSEKNYLVTLGITPKYPETGFGYIQAGQKLFDKEYKVQSFTEKPDIQKASQYIEVGGYFWNSGMFIWKVSSILSEFLTYQKSLYEAVKKYVDTNDKKYFNSIESISIDYAILEKSNKVAVIEADLDWSDLGSWRSVYDIQIKDSDGNVINGKSININSKNLLIQNTSNGRMIATVGLDNIVVVDTDDAVIVCDLDHTQDVKLVAEQLKKEKSELIDNHKTVFRPWGYYKILEDTDYFKSKRLVIYPNQSISLQYHNKRNETWTIVKGKASVIKGDENLVITVGETVYIPAGFNHRITNNTETDVELIEVQTGTYFGEDDIIRLDDQYNRT